jgi:WD40 repeat protein
MALVAGMQSGVLVLLDARTLEPKHTFVGHTDTVRCVRLVDGGRFFTGSKDKTAKIWDL